jgi:signal peptidase I
MRTKKLIKEARILLRRKARSVTPEGRKEVEKCIAGLERARSKKEKKQIDKGKVALRKAVARHIPRTKLDVVAEYAYSLATAVLIALIIRHFVVEPFKIPSGSMIPALQIGDKILVNKYIYGLRIPFTKTRLVELSKPKRWDVIVFTTQGIPDASQYPKNFVKRVAGLPGETLEIRDGEIYRCLSDGNGNENSELMAKPEWLWDLQYTNTQERQRIRIQEWDYVRIVGIRLPREVLGRKMPWAKGLPHESARGYWQYGKKGQKFTVPKGHYFVLGDKTTSSFDSRGWGFVPFGNIKGKVFCKWDFKPPFGRGVVR